jgi:hypothetical protein
MPQWDSNPRSVLERAKTVRALHRAATAIGCYLNENRNRELWKSKLDDISSRRGNSINTIELKPNNQLVTFLCFSLILCFCFSNDMTQAFAGLSILTVCKKCTDIIDVEYHSGTRSSRGHRTAPVLRILHAISGGCAGSG